MASRTRFDLPWLLSSLDKSGVKNGLAIIGKTHCGTFPLLFITFFSKGEHNTACLYMWLLQLCSLFSGFFWAAKVSMCFVFNLLKAVRIYVLAQITRRRDFAVKYGGRWAGKEGANAVCNAMREDCHISCGLWFYFTIENFIWWITVFYLRQELIVFNFPVFTSVFH